MKVLFLPDYSKMVNPYQANLASALNNFGITVVHGKGMRYFPILGAILCKYPQIVHLHWTSPYYVSPSKIKMFLLTFRFVFELVIAKLLTRKLIWTVHNLFDHERRIPWERWINKFLFKICNKVIVHSLAASKTFVKINAVQESLTAKISIIPHGNYINNYENQIAKAEARRNLRLDHFGTVFLFFGQVRPYKGIRFLIDSFDSLKDQKVALLVVGEPKCKQTALDIKIRSQNDTRISLIMERIPDEDVQVYMNASDVVVLPFLDILTSGSILLAMSFGKAIIAPRLGSVTEVLDENGAFLYSPEKENGLQLAMEEALRTDLIAKGINNFTKARKFDWVEIARKTCEVYRDY